MIRNRLFLWSNPKNLIKLAFLLLLIAAAGFSLVSLGTAITRAEFSPESPNREISAVSVSEASSSETTSIVSAASSTPGSGSSSNPAVALKQVSGAALSQTKTAAPEASAPAQTVKTPVKTVAKTTAVKTPVVKKSPTPSSSVRSASTGSTATVRWSSAALRLMSNIASFDYNYSIRRFAMNKIENYARSHHVTLITPAFISSIQD